MGGRGANSGIKRDNTQSVMAAKSLEQLHQKLNKTTPEVVDFKDWGQEISTTAINGEINGEQGAIGYVEDFVRYNSEPDIRPISLAEAKREIDAWLNDKDPVHGWSYGDNDVSIFVSYADGTQMSKDELNGKKFKKTGIIGVSVSTGDYEMVAGHEWHKGKQIPMQTWSEDGVSGQSNVYSGYKATETWKVRRVMTFEPKANGKGYKTVYKTIRESTHRKLE